MNNLFIRIIDNTLGLILMSILIGFVVGTLLNMIFYYTGIDLYIGLLQTVIIIVVTVFSLDKYKEEKIKENIGKH